MDLDRRDFFGVIAAPLLRRALPPVPMAVIPKVDSIVGPAKRSDTGCYGAQPYGQRIQISWSALVNDDLQVFAERTVREANIDSAKTMAHWNKILHG